MKVRLLFITLALTVSCSAQTATYGHNDQYLLPDRSATPGAINPTIIADPSGRPVMVNGVEANICAKDFTTAPYKKTTDLMKHQACTEYRAKNCSDPGKGELDYLIPLEIGGEDTIKNLWWQPEPDYRVKIQQVENKLKPMVCSGRISLKFAQSCIQHNWVNCMWGIEILEKCDKCSATIAPTIKVP